MRHFSTPSLFTAPYCLEAFICSQNWKNCIAKSTITDMMELTERDYLSLLKILSKKAEEQPAI